MTTTPARPRTSNGRSSIYLGADGRWHGRISVGLKPDGGADRRHVTAATQKEVTRKVRALEKARTDGAVTDAGRAPILEQWLDDWLASSSLRVRSSTLAGYQVDIRKHIVPAIGRHRLDRLLPEHIEHLYLMMLAKDGIGVGSVHHVRRTLSKALNDAKARGRISRNPVSLAHTPRYTPPDIQPLTTAEARKILVAASDELNGCAFIIALSLGLRRGEVLALHWSDLDLEVRRLTVGQSLSRRAWHHGCDNVRRCVEGRHHGPLGCRKHSLKAYPSGCPRPCTAPCTAHAATCPQRRGGGLVLDEPKTQKSRRTLPLPVPLVDALRTHRRAQAEARLLAGSMWQDNDFVFTGATGQPVDPNRHSEHWAAFVLRLGVRPARLHDARHTAATLLLVQGVDQRVVMDMFGWTSGSMTSRYQHVVPELQEEASRRMTELLWGAPK
jgi:integrase